jgi:hypothetical protein
MQPDDRIAEGLTEMAGRLTDGSVRNLFTRFCREVTSFSGDITVEITPFEARFSEPPGFRVHVSPYRDLFRVSMDAPNPCDFRVNAPDGYLSALDLALKLFLDARAETAAHS